MNELLARGGLKQAKEVHFRWCGSYCSSPWLLLFGSQCLVKKSPELETWGSTSLSQSAFPLSPSEKRLAFKLPAHGFSPQSQGDSKTSCWLNCVLCHRPLIYQHTFRWPWLWKQIDVKASRQLWSIKHGRILCSDSSLASPCLLYMATISPYLFFSLYL